MIKINLIGDEPEKSLVKYFWLAGYITTIVSSILAVFIFSYLSQNIILDLQDKIKISEAHLKDLRDKTKEVDGLKKTRDELQGVTLVIGLLRKSQQGPVRLLDDIAQSVPEKVWLSSIDSKVNSMKIEGVALDDASIKEFIESLRKSSYIPEADLLDRRGVPLVQVSTYNSFSGEQTKRVVRGDKSQVQLILTDIKKEAEDQGLNYSYGIPETNLKDQSSNTQNDPKAAITKLSFGNSSIIGGRATVYAWESLEEVKGLNFIVDMKVRYTTSAIDIDSLLSTSNDSKITELKK